MFMGEDTCQIPPVWHRNWSAHNSAQYMIFLKRTQASRTSCLNIGLIPQHCLIPLETLEESSALLWGGSIYLQGFFGHLLFARAGGVNEIMFLKVLLFKETLMETTCTTSHILKSLTFPLVKRGQHEGWNWEALSSRVKEERSAEGTEHSKQTKTGLQDQREFEKELFRLPAPGLLRKGAYTWPEWAPWQNWLAFRNKKCSGVRSRARCSKSLRLLTSLFQGQGYRQPCNTHRGLYILLWRLLRCLSKSIWPFFKVD